MGDDLAEPASTYSQAHEAMSRLGELGITAAVLREAVSRGLDARMRCTAFDPPSFPGTAQWAGTHRALRELLSPLGWNADDRGGFSTVVRTDGQVAITVAAGTGRTGKTGFPAPTTKYKRGPMTHAAVHGNQLAMSLYGEPVNESEALEEDSTRCITWILLVATEHDEVRMELSCPREIDETGQVVAWSERILLDAIGVEPTLSILPGEETDDEMIDVPVERL